MKKPIDIAHLWFEAFNSQNLEQLISLYDEDAQHYSPKLKLRQPETNGLISGKEALKEWWQDAFTRLPSLRYKPTKFIANENSVFVEYTREVDQEDSLQVGEVLEIENNLIIFSRVYHS
jgi:ketosteroid isomerase-like protein